MSTNYAPVLWNRQKRRYDQIMLGLVGLYLLVFAGLNFLTHPNISPETLIIRATGNTGFSDASYHSEHRPTLPN